MPINRELNRELNRKIFLLFIEGLISGAFIKAISESIKNSLPLLNFLWFFIVPIFAITDFIIWLKTGEEIITWILEDCLGINID